MREMGMDGRGRREEVSFGTHVSVFKRIYTVRGFVTTSDGCG